MTKVALLPGPNTPIERCAHEKINDSTYFSLYRIDDDKLRLNSNQIAFNFYKFKIQIKLVVLE